MALGTTKDAIGAVTEMLQTKLTAKTGGVTVSIGRPETAASSGAEGGKLNLFLYHVEFDGHLKNYPLDQGQPAPLWMVLHYLMTAYDSSKDSDSIDAHKLLGQGLAALQELNYLRPGSAPSEAPLLSNPEPLKITFDSADAELLSKLMQGGDEEYRVSAAFQIRPVLIAPEALPSYAPAVKTVGPPATPGVVVLPSMGPRLKSLKPERFEAGQTLTLTGLDLAGVDEVCIGEGCYAVTPAGDEIAVTVPLATTLSPGAYSITAVKILPSGRRFSSNALLGHLLPTLNSVAPGPLTPSGPNLFGDLTLNGVRLGGPDDSIFVALYQDGKTAILLEGTGVPAQNTLMVSVTSDKALPPGTYYAILRVNGAQAVNTPQVNWT